MEARKTINNDPDPYQIYDFTETNDYFKERRELHEVSLVMKYVEIVKKDITKTRAEKEKILNVIAKACLEEVLNDNSFRRAKHEIYPHSIALGNQQMPLQDSKPFFHHQVAQRKIIKTVKSDEIESSNSPDIIDNLIPKI